MSAAPHNWETERALLGGLLLDSQQLLEVLEIVKPEDFHKPAHKQLYQLLIELQARSNTYDVVSVLDEAERRHATDTLGGAVYLTELPSACPSVENLELYAKRVREHAVRRRLVEAAASITEEVQKGGKDLPTLLDSAEKTIFDIAQLSQTADWSPLGELVTLAINTAEERSKNAGGLVGLPTGFVDLDRILSGLQRTDLIILAARPAMGKTAFVLNILLNAAKMGNAAVGFFSLEMGKEQLATRLLTAEARVDAYRLKMGTLDGEDWRRLAEGSEVLHNLQIFIDDTPGLSILQLRSKARRLKSMAPNLGLLIIDYLQLMQGTGGSKESREQVISTISRGMKILAKELKIPIIALSQLNRSLESRTDKRPMLSDLRESGAIEQDADVILFIYRDEVYNPDSTDKGTAEIIIGKHRAGSIGKIKLAFLGQYTLFQNLADPSQTGDGYL